MAAFFRLLALSLLLHLSSHALAGNSIGKDDLDAQKELLLLKIDGGKELLQKDIEAQGKRLDAIDKRIDDQVSRVSDIGNAVDRFSVVTGWIGIVVTGVLALGGLLGFFSVAKKAREEAAEEAKKASKQWFADNYKELNAQIQALEDAATGAHLQIKNLVADVEAHSNSTKEKWQKVISSSTANNPEISAADAEYLRASDKQLKGKPEASYSFGDWNTRAFAAYQDKQFEEAALFWKYATEVPNAGAENTAQALFNRAVTLGNLERNEEATATYKQVIETYRADPAPAIRELVAKAMANKGVIHRQMGDSDQAIATYKQVIDTFRADPTPAIREAVAKAMVNKGVTQGQMGDNDQAIATYDQLIDTYRADSAPAIRELVAKAMISKGVGQRQMGDNDKAIATYDQVIATYRADPTAAIRELVAMAMNGRGFIRLLMAKQAMAGQNVTEANELLHKAIADLQAAIERKPEWGLALGNLAYVQWLLEFPAEAEGTFRTALLSKEHGDKDLYQATLDDIAQHPIPEDAGFREMIERLWAEYQAPKTS